MKRRTRLVGLFAVAAATVVTPAPAKGRAGIDQAGWLAGVWVTRSGGRWTEERWAPPRGGVMLGTSLSGEGAAASSYEYMRIAVADDGKLTFWGSPEGRPPVAFRLARAGPNLLEFENAAHDYPTRISYRREGEQLLATISGPNGANPMSWRYKRR
ncbi:MAG TPA: DUF6265 family protein [Allosphingosinicella sp.]|jgi:hypothetical protein